MEKEVQPALESRKIWVVSKEETGGFYRELIVGWYPDAYDTTWNYIGISVDGKPCMDTALDLSGDIRLAFGELPPTEAECEELFKK